MRALLINNLSVFTRNNLNKRLNTKPIAHEQNILPANDHTF